MRGTDVSSRSQAVHAAASADGQRIDSRVAPRVRSTWILAAGGPACSGAVAWASAMAEQLIAVEALADDL
jgi:hypothetical protein